MFSLHITLYLIDRTVIAAQDTLSINLVITYKGLKKQNKKTKNKTNKQTTKFQVFSSYQKHILDSSRADPKMHYI